MPHCMRFNAARNKTCAAKYTEVGKLFGVYDENASTEENVEAAILAIERMIREVGLKRSIVEMGGTEADITTLVEQALIDLNLIGTPVPLTREDILGLFLAALNPDTPQSR